MSEFENGIELGMKLEKLKKPKVTMRFVEQLICTIIDALDDDFDLPEDQRLYMQITDETRENIKKLLIDVGMEENP